MCVFTLQKLGMLEPRKLRTKLEALGMVMCCACGAARGNRRFLLFPLAQRWAKATQLTMGNDQLRHVREVTSELK